MARHLHPPAAPSPLHRQPVERSGAASSRLRVQSRGILRMFFGGNQTLSRVSRMFWPGNLAIRGREMEIRMC